MSLDACHPQHGTTVGCTYKLPIFVTALELCLILHLLIKVAERRLSVAGKIERVVRLPCFRRDSCSLIASRIQTLEIILLS